MNNNINDDKIKTENQIRLALQTGNIDLLLSIVPTLSEQQANFYIKVWKKNYEILMEKLKNKQDISYVKNHASKMLQELLLKSNNTTIDNDIRRGI